MNEDERRALVAAESRNLVCAMQLLAACARAILATDSGISREDSAEIRRLLERFEH